VKLSRELKAFRPGWGMTSRRPALLVRALTHSSLSSPTRPDNQRLEFLGDRVLGLVMAEALLDEDKAPRKGSLPRASTRWCARKPAPMSRARSTWASVLKLGKSEMRRAGGASRRFWATRWRR
jgi:ribonuclease-3